MLIGDSSLLPITSLTSDVLHLLCSVLTHDLFVAVSTVLSTKLVVDLVHQLPRAIDFALQREMLLSLIELARSVVFLSQEFVLVQLAVSDSFPLSLSKLLDGLLSL